MAIIISENGKNAKKIQESNFAIEDNLQSYIIDNPDSIPLYDVEDDIHLFIAAREFSTKSGPIDALGFDEQGNIYVIETKLFKNPDKRTVLAQALDYGASLWKNSSNFDDFITQLDLKCLKQFNKSFKEKFTEFYSLENNSDYIEQIKMNLQEGVIKYVVLMDKLHDPLKDLIIYMNQNSKFDIYAVELEYYKHKTFEIIIPKLYGAEVKKDVKSRRTGKDYMTPSDESTFWEKIAESEQEGLITPTAVKAIKRLDEISKQMVQVAGGSITYWRAKTNLQDVQKIIYNDPQDKVAFSINSDTSMGAWVGGKSGLQYSFLESILKEIINNRMFKKTEKNLNLSRWWIDLKKTTANDAQIQQFIQICESNAKKFING